MVLTHDERVQIITLQQEGYTYSNLALRFNVRKATITDLISKFRRTGSTDDLPGRGRHRALVRLVVTSKSFNCKLYIF
jgi:transposase